MEDQKHQLNELLPELSGLKAIPGDAPSVKLYDSAEGIRTVMKTVISEAKAANVQQLYGVSNLDQLHAFFPEIEAAQTNLERVQAGISSKYLYTSSRGPTYSEGDAASLRQSRYVPIDKYPLNGDATIIGSKIVLLALASTRPMGVIITSEALSKSLRGLFELAWEGAKQYNQNN